MCAGTKKTVEGSGMSVLTQLVVVMVIVAFGKSRNFCSAITGIHFHSLTTDSHVSMPTLREWGLVTGSVVATAIMEAYTAQIDNIIIPLFQLAFFLTFL